MVYNVCPYCGKEIRRIDKNEYACINCNIKFIRCAKCNGKGFIEQTNSEKIDYIDCDECFGQGIIKK